MSPNTAIVPAGYFDLPIGTQIANDLQKVSHDIGERQEDLNNILSNLESASIDINIERNWYGAIKKSSVEESLKNVYSNLCEYISQCGKALKNTNENLKISLKLIRLLALAEKDLYNHIDDLTISDNELKTVLLDWCKKQGITDEEITELLEKSFQRAYTLRDRINNLRAEYRASISLCEERIAKFESRHSALDEELERLVSETKSKLKTVLDEDINVLQKVHNERKACLQDLADKNATRLEEIVSDFEKKSEEEGIRLNQVLHSINESTAKMELLAKDVSVSFANYKKEFDDNAALFKKEFTSQIEKQKNDFLSEKAALMRQCQNKILLAIILSISISVIVSYVFITFIM